MNHCPFPSTIVLLFLAFSTTTLAYQWPSPQYDALEGMLYEGRRPDGSSLASLVHPCRKRPASPASVAAEWLRFAFHDMSTHDVSDGSGGLDASLVFELDRPANFGLAFNNTAADYLAFSNKYLSRSDIIALGATMAVATCGGPVLPFKGGRIDTLVAGKQGTPEPQDDISSLTDNYKRQGFTPSDMIKLIACGHTYGGVRSDDFPQLVPAGPNPALPNIVTFDTTPQFDNAIVKEYLDGTTQNPLVVTPNRTMASDFKIFSSDNNATVQGLADPTAFTQACSDVLVRMLNTVPSAVTLTDEITLLPAKASGVQLTIEQGKLVFKAALRLTQPANGTVNANRNVTMYWCNKYGSAKDCSSGKNFAPPTGTTHDASTISPIAQNLGVSFLTYSFVVPINGNESISKFWFEVDEHNGSSPTTYDNGGNGYQLPQDQVVFVPMLSSVVVQSSPLPMKKRGGGGNIGPTTRVFQFTAATRSDTAPSRVYMDALDTSMNGYVAPFNTTVDFKPNTTMPAVEGYTFYTATVSDPGLQLTFDLHAIVDGTTYTEDFVATSFLDNTPYVAPSSPQVAAGSGNSSSSASSIRMLFGGEWWGSVALLTSILLGGIV